MIYVQILGLTFLFICQIEAANYHLILTKDEKYTLTQNSLLIPFNDQEFNQSQVLNQSLILATEFEKHSYQNMQTIFTVLSDNKELIYIYSNTNSRIKKEFQVKNYVNDDQIIIEKVTSLPFTVDEIDCTFMHKIKDSVFILQCQKNETHSVFIILNEEEKVLFYELIIQIFDQLILYENQNCKKVSQYKFDTLLFYGTRCVQSRMYLIDIDPITFQFYPDFQSTTFSDHNDSILMEIEYCRQAELQLVYLDHLQSYNLQTKQFGNLTQVSCPNKETNKLNFYQDDFFQNLNQKIQIQQIESSIEVNNNLILFFENQVILINNQYLHQKLNQKFLQINILDNLPFFASLTENSDIIFYKVNQYDAFLQYQDTQFVAAFAIQDFNIQIKEFDIYEIEFYDIENPKIWMMQNIDLSYLTMLNEILLNLSPLQLGAPIVLNSMKIDNETFQFNNQYDNVLQCVSNFNLMNDFKLIFEQQKKIVFIYRDADAIIKIQDCEGKKNIILNDFKNVITFYVLKNQSVFILVMKRSIVFGQLDTNLNIEIMREYYFDQNIISTIQAQSTLTFLLQNCTVQKINIYQYSYVINSENLTVPCADIEAFQRNKPFIQGFQIIYEYQSNYKFRLTYETILRTEQYLSLFLVFHLSSKSIITINQFSIQQRLIFLKTLPTYQYKIKIPLQYLMQQFYLAVIAQLDDNSDALLVYNVKDSAANCLKSIIFIDKGNYNFGFFSQGFIYFVKNGTIRFQKLSDFIIKIPFIHKFEVFDFYKILELNLTSNLKLNVNEIIQVKLKYFNVNNTLRYRQNIREKYLTLYDNEIQDLNSIFGSIDQIVSEDSQCSIKAPLMITKFSFLCHIYIHRCCYQNYTLTCDHFGQKVLLQLDHSIQEIQLVEYTDNGFFLLFNDYFNQIFQLTYSNKTVQIKQLPNLLIYHQWLFQISIDRYFLRLKEEFVVLKLESGTEFIKYYIPSDDQEYKYINLGLDGVCIFSKRINNIIMDKIDIANQSKQLIIMKRNFNFKTFDIFEYIYSKGLLRINYILVSQLNQGYLGSIIVNIYSMTVVNETLQNNYLRLRFYDNYQKLIFLNKKKAIILMENQNNKFLRIFQFDQKTEMIDHIFSYDSPINANFEEYNLTHLVQIQLINNQSKIDFIEIGNYMFLCDQYSKEGHEVMIINYVSQMRTTVKYFRTSLRLSIVILILNFGLIVFVILQAPKRYKQIKRI